MYLVLVIEFTSAVRSSSTPAGKASRALLTAESWTNDRDSNQIVVSWNRGNTQAR